MGLRKDQLIIIMETFGFYSEQIRKILRAKGDMIY